MTVDDPLAAGIDQLVNNVSITDDGTNGPDEDPTDNQDTDTNTINAAPDLVITKDDGGATTTPGGTVVYTLVVRQQRVAGRNECVHHGNAAGEHNV